MEGTTADMTAIQVSEGEPSAVRAEALVGALAVVAAFAVSTAALGRIGGTVGGAVVQPLAWLVPAGAVAWRSRRAVGAALAGRGFAFTGFMAAAAQLTLAFLLGLHFGFGRTQYSFTALGAVIVVWQLGAVLLAKEVVRTTLVRALMPRGELLSVVVPWLLLFVASVPLHTYRLLGAEATAFDRIGRVLLPLAAAGLLATFLVHRGGLAASLAYLVPLKAFELAMPVLPDLPWAVAGAVGVLVPVAVVGMLPDVDAAAEPEAVAEEADASTGRSRLTWLHVAMAAVLMLFLTTGLFGIKPTIVQGVSMEPTMHAGDLLVTRPVDTADIEVGDVIRFGYGRASIVHRVIEIDQDPETGQRMFVTQGDNNPTPDAPVLAADVDGELVTSIPKVATPILWLKGLLS